MHFRETARSRPGIALDITPIVDTVFNLLIFFALSLNFIVTPGINVSLPHADTNEIIRKSDEFIIEINKDNAIFVGGKQIAQDVLSLLLSEAAQKNKDRLVIIQADQDSIHGTVVSVMDLAKRAGLTHLAIATAPIKQSD
jgi:biopolymer transport protein ExbD